MILTTLAVTFAAFCVWLTVRIVNRKKKPGWRFWTATALVVASIGYPASYGPSKAVWYRLGRLSRYSEVTACRRAVGHHSTRIDGSLANGDLFLRRRLKRKRGELVAFDDGLAGDRDCLVGFINDQHELPGA